MERGGSSEAPPLTLSSCSVDSVSSAPRFPSSFPIIPLLSQPVSSPPGFLRSHLPPAWLFWQYSTLCRAQAGQGMDGCRGLRNGRAEGRAYSFPSGWGKIKSRGEERRKYRWSPRDVLWQECPPHLSCPGETHSVPQFHPTILCPSLDVL